LNKNANFFANYFGENILEIIASVPGCRQICQAGRKVKKKSPRIDIELQFSDHHNVKQLQKKLN
jgi:hypothetical protein